MIGVCLGGSDVDKTIHPLATNLSCDAYKDPLIVKNKLSILVKVSCLIHWNCISLSI